MHTVLLTYLLWSCVACSSRIGHPFHCWTAFCSMSVWFIINAYNPFTSKRVTRSLMCSESVGLSVGLVVIFVLKVFEHKWAESKRLKSRNGQLFNIANCERVWTPCSLPCHISNLCLWFANCDQNSTLATKLMDTPLHSPMHSFAVALQREINVWPTQRSRSIMTAN